MATRGKITDLFDVPGIKDQYDQVMGFVREYVKNVEEASAVRLKVEESKTIRERTQALNELADAVKKYQTATDKTIQSQADLDASVKQAAKGNQDYANSQKVVNDTLSKVLTVNDSVTKSYSDLSKSIAENKISLQSLSAERKKLNADLKSGAISNDEYRDALASIIDRESALKLSGSELIKTLKNIQKESLATTGSVDQMEARLALLQQAFERLTPEEQLSDTGKAISKLASDLSNKINALKQSTGNFKDNVGRYADSLQPLFEGVAAEISKLKVKQDELNTSYQNMSETQRKTVQGFRVASQIQETDQAINALIQTQQIGFKVGNTYKGTINELTDSYKKMAVSGNFSQEFLDQFAAHIANSKRESEDLTKQIKRLSSETQALDQVTSGLSLGVNIYQSAAGAAALFNDDNDQAQKTITKLIAVQTVANGVRETFKEITEKGTVANKAYNFVVSQVSAIFNKASTAVQRFGAALNTVTIVAAIGVLTELIQRLTDTQDAAEKATRALQDFNDELERQKRFAADLAETDQRSYQAKVDAIKKANTLNESAAKDDLTLLEVQNEGRKKLYQADLENKEQQIAALVDQKKQGDQDQIELEKKFQKKYGVTIDEGLAYQKKLREQGKEIEVNKIAQADADIILLQRKHNHELAEEIIKGKSERNSLVVQGTIDEITAQKKKNDELKKLSVEAAQTELKNVTTKNEQVLNDERSTLAQRIRAIKAISTQQIHAAEVELRVSTDPQAQQKFNAEVLKITTEANDKIFKLNQQYRLRDIDALTKQKVTILQAYAEIAQGLAANDKLSYDQRLKAQQEFVKAQQEIANAEFKHDLVQAGFTDKQIAIIEAGNAKQLNLEKTKNDELEALTIDHETKLLKITSDSTTEVTNIIASELDKQVKLREDSISDIQRGAASTGLDTTKNFADEIIALNNALRSKKISREQYEKDRLKIENKYNTISLQNQIEALQRQLELVKKYNPTQTELEAERRLQAAKALLNNAKTDDEKKAATDRVAILQKEYDNAKAVNDQRIQLESDLVQAKKDADDAILASDEALKAARLQNLKDFISTATSVTSNLLSSAAEIQGIAYDRETASIQAATDALEKKKEKDTEVANQTITDEAEKQKAIEKINNDAAQQQAVLDQRKLQAEKKKAQFEKEANIASIISNTALAVVTTLGDKTITPGFLRIPLAITIGALGLAQLARAIAAPLPQFYQGKNFKAKDNYEGPAIVDEGPTGKGNAPETIIRANGKKEKGGNKPRIVWLWEKDKVIPAGKEEEGKPKKAKPAARKESKPNTVIPAASQEPKASVKGKQSLAIDKNVISAEKEGLAQPPEKKKVATISEEVEPVADQRPMRPSIVKRLFKRSEKKPSGPVDRIEAVDQPQKPEKKSLLRSIVKFWPKRVVIAPVQETQTTVRKNKTETSHTHKQEVIQRTVRHQAINSINMPDPAVINHYAVTAIHKSNDQQARFTPPPTFDNSDVVKEIKAMRKDVVRTIRDKQELNMNVTEKGIAAMYQHGANTVKYMEDQTNWKK